MTASTLLAIHSMLLLFCIIKILILEHRFDKIYKRINTICDIIVKNVKMKDKKEDIIDESN